VTGVVCTVDSGKRDAEIKLLIGCTREEAAEILAFLNKGTMSARAGVAGRFWRPRLKPRAFQAGVPALTPPRAAAPAEEAVHDPVEPANRPLRVRG